MKKVSLVIFSLLISPLVGALETDPQILSIQNKIQKTFPELKVERIKKSPLKGLYQVNTPSQILYVNESGRYLVAGDILDLEKPENTRNLTERARQKGRKILLKTLSEAEMIRYSPSVVKGRVTVLTDPDCGYCRQLHQEIPLLNQAGVEVRYLAFPRQGAGSSTYTKMVSAWCASDPRAALDQLMKGETIPEQTCPKAPIDHHMALAQKLNIAGTPTLIFEDGTLVGGYLPAEKLSAEAILHRLQK